jgi:hypothetical protein
MKKQNKIFLLVLFVCTINISWIYAANTYWESSYDPPVTNKFSLKEINVTNLYQANGTSSSLISSGTYQGYSAGKFTIDFGADTTFKEYFKDHYKKIITTSEGNYYYNDAEYWNSTNRTSISDESNNHSRVSCFIHIFKYEGIRIVDNIWYDMTNSNYYDYYNDNSFFQDIKTNKIEFQYFYIIDDIANLKPNEAWTLFVPLKSVGNGFPLFELKIVDYWTLDNYVSTDSSLVALANNYRYNTSTYSKIKNEVYDNTGLISIENGGDSSDIYSLNIGIQKKYNDSDESFFNGQIHDYYSMNFDSYKYGVLTEEPFSICLEISSAHNWYLYLDNEENPSNNEKIAYELYLKYKTSAAYNATLISNNQNKILIKNIKSSNASSILYLQTKCDNARADFNTKGEYQDTVYLNFITEGWNNGEEDSFAEKTITLQ